MKNYKNIANVSPFDVAEFLQTDEDIAEYLNQVFADNDAGELAAALGYIAKAKGMAEIAKASGLTREALYKALETRLSAQARHHSTGMYGLGR
jgi:probable addiction module antidote protein